MEAILVAATILGGIVAIWFFYEKASFLYKYIYRLVINEGYPFNYDDIDKEWCNITQKRWKRIRFKNRYVAWDGPLVLIREFSYVAWSHEHIDALRRNFEFDLKYAIPFRVEEYKDKGFSKLFETDCRTWRREIIDRDQFEMMIQVKNEPNKIRRRIFKLFRALKKN